MRKMRRRCFTLLELAPNLLLQCLGVLLLVLILSCLRKPPLTALLFQYWFAECRADFEWRRAIECGVDVAALDAWHAARRCGWRSGGAHCSASACIHGVSKARNFESFMVLITGTEDADYWYKSFDISEFFWWGGQARNGIHFPAGRPRVDARYATPTAGLRVFNLC